MLAGMPRRARIFVDGGLYHVYNRAAHGTPVFADGDAGDRFVEILAEVMRLDGHLVFAWACLSNHYHVVLRTSAVSLARSFGRIQSGFGRWRNRTLQSRGPTWQSRYKAKLVEDESYLLQLIAYVHLNPVSAGLVDDPAEYLLSGHRELVGLGGARLIAKDEVLSLYGETEREAQSSYVSTIGALADSEDWVGARPGRLPWWRRTPDRALDPVEIEPALAADGRPSRAVRASLDADQFLGAACFALNIDREALESRTRCWDVSRPRIMIVGLGIERWRQSATCLARLLFRRPDLISWWAKRAVELRSTDQNFANAYVNLDERMRSRFG